MLNNLFDAGLFNTRPLIKRAAAIVVALAIVFSIFSFNIPTASAVSFSGTNPDYLITQVKNRCGSSQRSVLESSIREIYSNGFTNFFLFSTGSWFTLFMVQPEVNKVAYQATNDVLMLSIGLSNYRTLYKIDFSGAYNSFAVWQISPSNVWDTYGDYVGRGLSGSGYFSSKISYGNYSEEVSFNLSAFNPSRYYCGNIDYSYKYSPNNSFSTGVANYTEVLPVVDVDDINLSIAYNENNQKCLKVDISKYAPWAPAIAGIDYIPTLSLDLSRDESAFFFETSRSSSYYYYDDSGGRFLIPLSVFGINDFNNITVTDVNLSLITKHDDGVTPDSNRQYHYAASFIISQFSLDNNSSVSDNAYNHRYDGLFNPVFDSDLFSNVYKTDISFLSSLEDWAVVGYFVPESHSLTWSSDFRDYYTGDYSTIIVEPFDSDHIYDRSDWAYYLNAYSNLYDVLIVPTVTKDGGHIISGGIYISNHYYQKKSLYNLGFIGAKLSDSFDSLNSFYTSTYNQLNIINHNLYDTFSELIPIQRSIDSKLSLILSRLNELSFNDHDYSSILSNINLLLSNLIDQLPTADNEIDTPQELNYFFFNSSDVSGIGSRAVDLSINSYVHDLWTKEGSNNDVMEYFRSSLEFYKNIDIGYHLNNIVDLYDSLRGFEF